MQHNRIVSQEEWFAAHAQHLAKEKELTRRRDALSAARRELPWVNVEKTYLFDTANGEKTLADLFAGRNQLIIYHFMFGPGWKEGCVGCSFQMDHVEGALVHLAHRDVTFVAVSRAPLSEIEAFQQRMGWRFTWVSSYGSDFNYDYHVSFTQENLAKGPTYYNYRLRDPQDEGEASGTSVFYKDEAGAIFHTYSCYARGDEVLIGTYNYLDFTPKGRDEESLPYPSAWWRHHDRYEEPQTHTCRTARESRL